MAVTGPPSLACPDRRSLTDLTDLTAAMIPDARRASVMSNLNFYTLSTNDSEGNSGQRILILVQPTVEIRRHLGLDLLDALHIHG